MARISLSWLMGVVAIIALGLAAMRVGSLLACSAAMGALVLALCIASLGAIIRPAPAAPWRGFALFAWLYVGSTFLRPDLGWGEGAALPFGLPVLMAAERLHPTPVPPQKPTNPAVLNIRLDKEGHPVPSSIRSFNPSSGEGLKSEIRREHLEEAQRYHRARTAHFDSVMARGKAVENATRIGHASQAIVFGIIGAIAGRVMAPAVRDRGDGPSGRPSTPRRSFVNSSGSSP